MTTIADLLFDVHGGEERRHLLANALRAPALPLHALLGDRLPVTVLEVAATIHRLLDLPVGDVALRGWSRHRAVAAARRATAEAPGERQVVRIAQHSIKSRRSPTVEATHRGLTTTVMTLDLDIELELAAVELVVVDGEVDDVVTTRARGKARLSSHRAVLAERTFQPADLRRREVERPAPQPRPTGQPAGLRVAP